MALLFRKKGFAAKIEATYGVDPVVDPATDSILHANFNLTPLDGDFVNRDLDRAVLGAQGDILVSSRVLADFLVESAGSGAAGTAPPYGELFRACGMGETVNVGTDVQYDPVSTGFSSLFFEANYDGNEHTARGARGNLSFQWETKAIPRFNFAFQGLYNAPIAAALPAYDVAAFQIPEAFNNANTPTALLHGEAIALRAISLDLQNDLQHLDVIGQEEIVLVDREVNGTIEFQAPLISAKDWFAASAGRAAGILQIVHGDTAGNIVTVDAPAVEINVTDYSDSQGVLMISADLILKPNSAAGNDEVRFTFS